MGVQKSKCARINKFSRFYFKSLKLKRKIFPSKFFFSKFVQKIAVLF